MTETAADPDQPDTAAALGPGHPETALRRNILAALCRFLDGTANAVAPERRPRAGRR